jgi:hypothetical protein
MPPLVPRREYFNGPERLSPAWTLKKGTKTASCEVWSHILGHELRAFVGGELVQSSVCKTLEELVSTQEQWRTAFEAKGWKR